MGDTETEGRSVEIGEREIRRFRDGGRREDLEGWRNKCLDRGTKIWGEITRRGRQTWSREMQRWKGGGAGRWRPWPPQGLEGREGGREERAAGC